MLESGRIWVACAWFSCAASSDPHCWLTLADDCVSMRGRLSVELALRFSMIGQFFNQTLPSSIGGDATRIWLLGRRTGWRAATYSVLLDRVVGVVALAILVTICLPGSLPMVRNTIGRSALLVIGLGCIGAGVVFVSLASKRLIILQRWPLTRDLAAAADIAVLILRSPSLLTEIFALSIFIHILTALAAWCAVSRYRGRYAAAVSAFSSTAGHADHDRANFDRRMGRSRKRNDRRLRLCRPATE